MIGKDSDDPINKREDSEVRKQSVIGKDMEEPVKQRDEDLALLDAASGGKMDQLMQAIRAGANLEARDGKDGNTPLIWGAFSGHLSIVKALIKEGANINALSDDSHKTALMMASYFGHAQVVEYLLQKGADINAANSRGDTSVAVASYMNHTAVVGVLLQYRANLKKRTISHYYQPLHLAAYKGHTQIVEMLLQFYHASAELEDSAAGGDNHSPDINAIDREGNSPLMLAAMQGHPSALFMLLHAGASVSLLDNLGNTALMLAANKGHLETVTVLLDWFESKDDSPNRGAHESTRSTSASSAAVLWHLEKANKQGQTPLLRTCIKGFTPIFKILLMRGANIGHRGSDGKDCEKVAKEKKWKEMVRLIGEYRKSGQGDL